MDRLEFALSLIRAPWLQRLRDRSFLTLLGTALGAVGGTIAIWQTHDVPVGEKVNTTIAAYTAVAAVVGFWNHGNQKKDTAIATAALAQGTPANVNVGTVEATPKQSAADVLKGAGESVLASAAEKETGFDFSELLGHNSPPPLPSFGEPT